MKKAILGVFALAALVFVACDNKKEAAENQENNQAPANTTQTDTTEQDSTQVFEVDVEGVATDTVNGVVNVATLDQITPVAND